ncbi:MAG: RNA polymerase subunit sigma-70 [Bacteroidetes bacterium]|nr:MAG: RNA polymerase subunit sigma-70 [Bacteroidota bacterium]PIE88206.1 MAG: RNA polymerase subunit sigma-70 [Bacteroidota bacterium]
MHRLTQHDLCKEVIEDCLKGKKRAFRKLYHRYSGLMLGICMRYARNQSEAEDILQEGFIKIYQNLKGFRFQGSFEGWMKRIMVNTALNYNRNNLKHHFHLEINEVEVFSSPNETVTINKHEYPFDTEDLMKMIQALPTGYRTVFNLYIFEGYSHKEIAEMLQISENTSKSQLSKARKNLQNIINKATDKK